MLSADLELSERELAVLRLLATDLSQREIGTELYVSFNTVKSSHAERLPQARRDQPGGRGRARPRPRAHLARLRSPWVNVAAWVMTAHPARGEGGAHAGRNGQWGSLPGCGAGGLGEHFVGVFSGIELEKRPGESVLTGAFDQSQLHGLLDRLRDLGIELVSVNPAN